MAEHDSDGINPATRLVIAGRKPEWTGTAGHPSAVVNPPVWRASTHLYPDMASLRAGHTSNADGHFYYGRRGAPTQWALADALTAIEPEASGTVLYPSGVAAIAGVLLAVLKPGDLLLMTDNAYEPSRTLARGMLADMGVVTQWFDPLDLDGFAQVMTQKPAAVLFEAPGSLTMEIGDLPAMAALCRQHGAISIIDNTWASPLGFAALAHGLDISLMSLTKHVGGHSDLMLGSASAGEALYGRLRRHAQQLGTVVSPDDAAMALRGLRTLGLRLERSSASALALAQWLAGRDEVAAVLCPMLEGAAGHELWRRDFTGGCGLFSFVFKGGSAAARDAFIDALALFGIGYSWGGFESLATPVDPARVRTATPWPPAGLAAQDCCGVRLAVGLEDPADLIADLEQAMAVWRKA